METNLETTNILLGIMAAVSVLEALLIVGLGIAGWRAYRRMLSLVIAVEARHVLPAMARVNRLLDDISAVTATVKDDTERVDYAIHRTIGRVDDTARRMRSNVVAKTSRLVGFVRGVRVAIESLLVDDDRSVQDERSAPVNART